MKTNRREWMIETGALAALGTAFGQQAVSKPWFDRPMRWAQLAFVEDDPGRYDPSFWLDYFKRIHADAACLSAGGCVAFYPTKVPLHYRSKFLGNGDAFGEMLAGCRKLGMNVIARVDPHAAHQDVYDAHPDWIAVEANGKPRRHWAMSTLVGHLRARPLQLRVHDRRHPGDHDPLQGRWHLREPLERVGHVLLRALPAEFQGVQRPRPDPRHYRRTRRGRRGRRGGQPVRRVAETAPLGAVHALGRRDQEAQPGCRVLP